MSNRHLRLSVLIGAALVVGAAVTWRLATGGDRYRRKGDVAALGREVSNSDLKVAQRAVDALGVVGPKAVSEIEKAMGDDRPKVRAKAAIALASAGHRDRTALLAKAARDDPSADVRATAVSALGQVYAYNEMETLLAALEDGDVTVRRRAAEAICRITGVDFAFRADDPPEKRRKIIAIVRHLWPKMEPRVRDYYTPHGDDDER